MKLYGIEDVFYALEQGKFKSESIPEAISILVEAVMDLSKNLADAQERIAKLEQEREPRFTLI